MTEDYVSFETAKLLHSCGFWSDECVALYDCGNNNEFVREDAIFQNGAEDYLEYEHGEEWGRFGYYLAPTIQMAMKWLREKHNLLIVIDRNEDHYVWSLEDNKTGLSPEKIKMTIGEDNTYEEACEAGIKYCLENLI